MAVVDSGSYPFFLLLHNAPAMHIRWGSGRPQQQEVKSCRAPGQDTEDAKKELGAGCDKGGCKGAKHIKHPWDQAAVCSVWGAVHGVQRSLQTGCAGLYCSAAARGLRVLPAPGVPVHTRFASDLAVEARQRVSL